MKKIKASEINSGDVVAFEQTGPGRPYVAYHEGTVFMNGECSDWEIDRTRLIRLILHYPGECIIRSPCIIGPGSLTVTLNPDELVWLVTSAKEVHRA